MSFELAHAGAVQSMSRRGNCWDNAVAESFFSTLEFEMDPGAAWRWAADGERELFTFIESYYNARRLHSRNRLQESERNRIRLALARAGGITSVSTESGQAQLSPSRR
jgi:transposase InsO family protein